MLSYLKMPRMTLLVVTEQRRFYVSKNQNNFIKNKQYWSYINFNIIIPNMSTCFSIAVFYSKCLTPYTNCESLNSHQLPCCCSTGFFTIKWEHHYSNVFYTEGVEVTVQLKKNCAVLCWQWGNHSREIL